ncbi:MAG: bifunctional cytidylyltransferase/SDR family oxidoreductase [Bifidobacteriaceae bacterium]|nr:bifunctional cytidylyltransferase/SDR family oxidoreductase [Bifidobacteriaceae bacterium]
MKTYGVVLAGGVGTRVGLDVPKQLIKVAGKTILEHTVGVLNDSPDIDEVLVMITPGWSEQVATLLGDRYAKLTKILEGGLTRNDTTMRCLDWLGDQPAKLVLHDAVRPLLDQRIIHQCVVALDEVAAVDVVIASSDTIVQVNQDEVITAIPERAWLRRGQTPQAFRLSTLRDAYAAAAEDPDFHATDDCGVVLKYLPNTPIRCVPGSEDNIKVTHPVDLFIADKLFQLASAAAPERSQTQIAQALAGKVVVVLGGSYGIGAEIAYLAGQAGATVVAHGRSTTGLHVQDGVAIEQALAKIAAEHGHIDAIVVTAGVLRVGPLATTPLDWVSEAVAVNYLGPVNVARAAYPHLAASQGHLMLFTSSSYTRGRANYSLYSSSKAAVVNLAQALSEEWSEAGIKVNAINPERTATPMRQAAFGEEPADTLLSAQEVARSAVAVLASQMTGLVVDVRRDQAKQ